MTLLLALACSIQEPPRSELRVELRGAGAGAPFALRARDVREAHLFERAPDAASPPGRFLLVVVTTPDAGARLARYAEGRAAGTVEVMVEGRAASRIPVASLGRLLFLGSFATRREADRLLVPLGRPPVVLPLSEAQEAALWDDAALGALLRPLLGRP